MKKALYLLRLLEGRKLNQVDLQDIMTNTSKLIDSAVCDVLKEAQLLEGAGCSHAKLLDHLIEAYSPPAAIDFFETFKSTYRQKKYFEHNMGMIKPVRVLLPPHENYFGRSRTGKPQFQKVQSFVTVSLIDQLSLLLNRKDVYEEVFKVKQQADGLFSRFEDGSAYKTNDLFKREPNSLQIHLYLDEAQVCDPLGSKTIENKMVFVYFSLGNLEVKHRTNLKSLFLLSIFPNHQVKAYGLDILLRPLVEELKKLENGIDFTIGEAVKRVYGTVAIFTADNLASHQVGGFKLGFANGYRRCRYCLATDRQIQACFTDCYLTYRTIDGHKLQCRGLDTQYREHFARLYGITHNSILNELQYFHVIGGMVPDVMHDLLEGVLPKTICLMIESHIKEKFYSIKLLNHALRNFNYGHGEIKDKPSMIDIAHIKKRKLRQSASQLWQLAVTLPLAVGSRVPKHDEKWLCFLSLLELSRLIFKPSITDVEILSLEFLVEDFLSSFKKCYPNNRLSPKFHFLTHYGREIRRLGPLVAYWCMRYEAKHSYFKQLSRAIGNYINLPWTFSHRHQQWMCKNFNEYPTDYLKFEIQMPKMRQIVQLNKLKCFGQVALLLKLNLAKENIESVMLTEVPWISIGSNCYKINKTFLLCPFNGSVAAVFGNLIQIFLYGSQIVFICELYHTVQFDLHLQAFQLKKRRRKLVLAITSNTLLDYRVYHTHSPVDLSIERHDNAQFLYVIPKTEMRMLLVRDI